MNYKFAIRDTNDKAIHTSRYACIDDAMSAAEELAYEMEMDVEEFEIVELVERVNGSKRIVSALVRVG